MIEASQRVGDLAIDVGQVPPLGHEEGMRLAEIEYQRVLDLVRMLDPGDWERPTDCTEWTVKDIVVHLIGAAEGMGSIREMIHQVRASQRLPRNRPRVDRVNAVQVADRHGLPIDELPDRLVTAFASGLRGRRRVPALLRSIRTPIEDYGTISYGLLNDVIYTRDAMVHRIDITRATGKPMVVTPEHEGRLVADVVRDWASRHGSAFSLRLTGPGGGTYVSGIEAPPLELDALEFCRILSGRAPGDGLLKTRVLF